MACTPCDGTGATRTWETRLVARIAAGDETALAEVYDQYAPMVFGLAQRVLAERLAAEDVTQEVFVFLWERPEAFDAERGSLRSWLGVVTHRRAVDRVRREEAERRRADAAALQPMTAPPDMAEAATSVLIAERVRDAVAQLPEEQRAAVMLAYFEGKTYVEVAEILGIPEGTAKSRMRLALRKLAGSLQGEGISPWT